MDVSRRVDSDALRGLKRPEPRRSGRRSAGHSKGHQNVAHRIFRIRPGRVDARPRARVQPPTSFRSKGTLQARDCRADREGRSCRQEHHPWGVGPAARGAGGSQEGDHASRESQHNGAACDARNVNRIALQRGGTDDGPYGCHDQSRHCGRHVGHEADHRHNHRRDHPKGTHAARSVLHSHLERTESPHPLDHARRPRPRSRRWRPRARRWDDGGAPRERLRGLERQANGRARWPPLNR